MGHEKGFQATRLSVEKRGFPVFTEIQRVVRVLAGLFKFRKGREAAPAVAGAPEADVFPEL